jgi:ATP-dependent helicase/nuclease subunit A
MSEAFEWSDEQLDVIGASASTLVVTAAAGAGKTRVLVARYLRHVQEQGLQPDQILTITFTKKAAAEMKKRIVEALRERGMDEEAQIAETGPIQTIHSFCERLLRENSLEAGLDPAFEILTEAHATRLVTQCIREALAGPLDDEPNAEELVAFLAGKTQAFGESRGPYSRLEGAVVKVLADLRGSGLDRDDIAAAHQNPRSLRDHWEAQLLRAQPEPVRFAYPNVDAGTIQERLQLAFGQAKMPVPSYLKGKPDADAEEQALSHTCGLVQLAVAAWWRLEREFHVLQALDFTGLEARAVRLLVESEATRERVRRQYQVVMVDEAQDVNPVQYRLLDRLQSSQTMMVGDAQQSIYGFRQADVALFRQRASEFSAKRLTRNFRSEQGILNFVDRIFGSLWSGTYVPMNAVSGPMDLENDAPRTFEGVELWRQEPKDLAAVATFARELIDEGNRAKDLAFLVRDGVGAVAVKAVLEAAGIEARIAGGTERFYTRIEVRDLANALRAVANPDDDFALLACLRSPMAGLSLDSIILLGKDPGVAERLDDFEPEVQGDRQRLDEFLAWFRPLCKYADRLSAWEVLSEIFAKSEYLAGLAKRTNSMPLLANARKLLSLATQDAELGPLEFAERIREIQDLRHKEGDAPAGEEDADVATIMTVHKAKGLEFKIVILCQTDKPLTRSAQDVVIDSRLAMVATKFGPSQSLAHRFLASQKKDRDYAEELRVLYVALTRAQNRLCISLYPAGRAQSASKLLDETLGASGLPGLRFRDGRLATAAR